MRRGYLFWGSALILLSILFFIKAIVKDFDVLGYFWLLFLILLGTWILVSAFIPLGTSTDNGERFEVDLQGANQAKIEFNHGVGKVEITSGAPSGQLMTGTKAMGMDVSSKMKAGTIEAKVNTGPNFIPFIGPSGGVWRIQLTQEVPLTLDVHAGASQLNIDLSNMKVSYLNLETGASSVHLTMPQKAGNTLTDIKAGAASIDITIPQGVSGRIHVKEGISSLNIDKKHFPKTENGFYQSPDYDNATNRVDLNIEAGVGSISIH